MDTKEIRIDELSKWKQTLEAERKELLSQEIEEIEEIGEQIIRFKVRCSVYHELANIKETEREGLENKNLKKLNEIDTILAQINSRLQMMGVFEKSE
ncbi:MAG: hypothetical protein P4L69_02695 [Desulfosporosinus sp.]|nr:hypothetical protein [Desulfosporosinus sp.]